MTEPDARHLDAEAKGRAAASLLGAAREVFSGERHRIERDIAHAVDEARLTPDAALCLCARLDALARLERHLETLVRQGSAASKRLGPARSGSKVETS